MRPAEAAEGSVRHGIGLRTERSQLKAGVEIGIVGVEHGAVVDRPAQVVAIATAAGHGAFDAGDPAGVVEADGVVDAEVVALAGQHEIVVPVETEPDRASGALHPQRCDDGQRGCLGFLAAKGAAHAADFDGDFSRADPQRCGGKVLNLRGVLGGGDDVDTIQTGQGEAALSFEVKVLLPTDVETTTALTIRAFDRCGRIAALEYHGIVQEGVGLDRLIDRGQRRQLFAFQLEQARGLAGLDPGFCEHAEQRLPGEQDLALGEQRFIMDHRTGIVLPRDIASGDYVDHARRRVDGIEVQRRDLRATHGCKAKTGVERAGGRLNIVDIQRRARDVLRAAVVGAGAVHLPRGQGRLAHAAAASPPAARLCSSSARSRLRLTSIRYQAEARRSSMGLKSLSSAATASSISAGVRAWPSSTACVFLASCGVAAMPPKPSRTAVSCSPSACHAKTAMTALIS